MVGISGDSVTSHEGFASKHRLPFVLLSDAGGEARAAFGVPTSLLGLIPGRVTFVVDRQGVIRNAFESQLRVGEHVRRALELVRTLARGASAPTARPPRSRRPTDSGPVAQQARRAATTTRGTRWESPRAAGSPSALAPRPSRSGPPVSGASASSPRSSWYWVPKRWRPPGLPQPAVPRGGGEPQPRGVASRAASAAISRAMA